MIVATEFKRYRKFPPSASDVDIGICFFTTGGDRHRELSGATFHELY